VLVRKLHLELENKKKRMTQMNGARSNLEENKASIAPISFCKRRKLAMEETAERRAIIMVSINAFVIFFLRIPELLFVFTISQELFGATFYAYIALFSSSKLILSDLLYFAYILSLTSIFFINFIFNQKFKQTFSKWTHVKPKS
jgi:hypothetical protein